MRTLLFTESYLLSTIIISGSSTINRNDATTPAQSIFFSERYFSMGIALRPENQYRSLSFTDAVSMLDKR